MGKRIAGLIFIITSIIAFSLPVMANSNNYSITNSYVFIRNIAPIIVKANMTTDSLNRIEPGDPINFTANVTDDNGVPQDIIAVNATLDFNGTQVKNIRYNYFSSGVFNSLYANISTGSLIPPGSPFGVYTLNVAAIDSQGLTDYYELKFNVVDFSGPTITFLNDTPDPVSPIGLLNITANLTDNYDISSAWVDIEGINYTMTRNGGSAQGSGIVYYHAFTPYLSPGLHNYTVYANDTFNNLAVPKKSNFTVTTLVSLDLKQDPVSFGNASPGDSMRRAENGTSVPGSYEGTYKGFPMIVNNTGNIELDFSLAGTALVGQTNNAYSIGVGNMTWNTTSVSALGTRLSTSPAVFDNNIAMSSNSQLYFWIDVPYGLPSQQYSGSINISAVQS